MRDEANNSGVTSIDKIVTVCAVLVNLGDGIVTEKKSKKSHSYDI